MSLLGVVLKAPGNLSQMGAEIQQMGVVFIHAQNSSRLGVDFVETGDGILGSRRRLLRSLWVPRLTTANLGLQT